VDPRDGNEYLLSKNLSSRREAAANMLRIIRGAGKPYALLKQMSDVVAAAVKVRDVTGQLPTDILETVEAHCAAIALVLPKATSKVMPVKS
jgi:hypothetical protein